MAETAMTARQRSKIFAMAKTLCVQNTAERMEWLRQTLRQNPELLREIIEEETKPGTEGGAEENG